MKNKLKPKSGLFWTACLCTACGISSLSAQTDATYSNYRFTPTKLRDNDAAISIQLSEFVFINDGDDLFADNLVVEVPGGNSPAGEQPENLLDVDTGTKWLNFNKFDPILFEFQDGEGQPLATTIDAYTFATGGDAPERDPVSWTLEGSNDGNDWVLLDLKTDYPTVETRSTYEINIPLLILTVESFSLNRTGGTIVLKDNVGQTDPDGTFEVAFNDVTLPASAFTFSKEGGITTINFDAEIEPFVDYPIEVTVPLLDGGTEIVTSQAPSFRLPSDLPGEDGSVGSWAIREYTTEATAVGDLLTAGQVASEASVAFVDGTAPVFNHSDPDTNGPLTTGNFNNDFPVLSDTAPGTINEAGNDAWVVVGRTLLDIPEAGTYTFSVHSDDGFAMRVTGGGGGEFISSAGDGKIDPGDSQSLVRDPVGGTGDSNTRGTYQFDAGGTYELTYLGWDGEFGGFYEVAWAEGDFDFDRDTATWELVGNPDDPSIPEFQDRYPALPGSLSDQAGFAVRTYLQAMNGEDLVGGFNAAITFLEETTRQPSDADGLTNDSQQPYLNHRDPDNGGFGFIPGDLPFPGNTEGTNNDNVVTVAKGRIQVANAGTYTFQVDGDDGMLLRLTGAGGLPDPEFDKASQGGDANAGRFEMSNRNLLFYDALDGVNTRGVIDLQAGAYDIEFVHLENGGGFHYELAVAPGEWLHGSDPEGGFQLVGLNPANTANFPGIADPGWTVETAAAGSVDPTSTIEGAINGIEATLALDPQPEGASTLWPELNFNDPEDGLVGSFEGTQPWPLNTDEADDDYAMRATGNIVITEAGDYHLGFQGDDGGYIYIYGDSESGTTDPIFDSIVFTNLPDVAVITSAPDSTVNNAIEAETGTGNSRTLGNVNLEVGQYRIETLVFEGEVRSWWEVIGGPAIDRSYNYPLLTQGEGETINLTSGFTLIPQDGVIPDDSGLMISGFTLMGNPVTEANFTFGSQADATYTVEASLNLENWILLNDNLPSGGASTAVSVDVSGVAELSGQPKVFFRVRQNP
jgi:hypothetical protein